MLNLNMMSSSEYDESAMAADASEDSLQHSGVRCVDIYSSDTANNSSPFEESVSPVVVRTRKRPTPDFNIDATVHQVVRDIPTTSKESHDMDDTSVTSSTDLGEYWMESDARDFSTSVTRDGARNFSFSEASSLGLLPWLPSEHSSYRRTEIFDESTAAQSSYCSRFMPAKKLDHETEARRLADLINLFERGRLSQRVMRQALSTKAVNACFTYDVIMSHILRRSGIELHWLGMCRNGHVPLPIGTGRTIPCPADGCVSTASSGCRYWFCKISETISALCAESHSFQELMDGCYRAQQAVNGTFCERMFDYYDGKLFKRKYGSKMRDWDPKTDLFVFVTMSTDGFEVCRSRTGSKSAWPVAFTILNLSVQYRFRAANVIIAAFVPGAHKAESFDDFLNPIIADLHTLEKGIYVKCADGLQRRLRVFVMFFTSDWPAGTKTLGFRGHTASKPCRYCHKSSKWIYEANGHYLVPEREEELLECSNDAKNKRVCEQGIWITAECPRPRSDKETRAVWREIECILAQAGRGYKNKVERVMKRTGIKRRPALGKLSLDFVNSTPYDPMHCVLLGWVKHLVSLCTGVHPKAKALDPSYLIESSALQRINACLENSARGIPAAWGRALPSVEYLAMYKAEDFKTLGLYFGAILFDGDGIDERITTLWGLTSTILNIVLDPTPQVEDVYRLHDILEQTHSIFTDTFYLDSAHAFCFTPNTHAMLHMAEMMAECGPLTNVSQFTIERLIGEIGSMATSKLKPEANLMKKSHRLLCINLMNGGINGGQDHGKYEAAASAEEANKWTESAQLSDQNQQPENVRESVKMLGVGKVVGGAERRSQALQYVQSKIPLSATNVTLNTLKAYARASLGNHVFFFQVETRGETNRRARRSGLNVRQKSWVAGQFRAGAHSTSSCDSADSEPLTDVHYGCIDELWELKVDYDSSFEQLTISHTYLVARVIWQNGLYTHSITGFPYTKLSAKGRRGTLRDTWTTVEEVSSIRRLVGYVDYLGRRYFFDPERRSIEQNERISLGGLREG